MAFSTPSRWVGISVLGLSVLACQPSLTRLPNEPSVEKVSRDPSESGLHRRLFTVPSNDARINALDVTSPDFSIGPVSTQEATLEANEPAACADVENTLWYVFRPSATTGVRVRLEATDSSPKFTVFEGTPSSPPEGLRFLTCASTEFGSPAEGTFYAQSGRSYLIQVGKRQGLPPGTFTLTGTALDPIVSDIQINPAVSIAPDPVDRTLTRALISGTITTTKSSTGTLFVHLRQKVGHLYIIEAISGRFDWDGEGIIPWSVVVPSHNGTWTGGPAQVKFDAFTCDENFCPDIHSDWINVRLRTKRK